MIRAIDLGCLALAICLVLLGMACTAIGAVTLAAWIGSALA